MVAEQVRILTLVFDPASYAASLYAFPTAATSVSVLCLGLFVLIRERLQMVSLSFFLATLAVAVWLFSFSWMYCATDPRVALWWAKAAYVGVPYIAPAFYHFTVAVLGLYDRRKRMVWINWGLASLFMLAILTTDGLVAGLHRYWWGYYPRYGWLSLPYLAFFFGLTLLTLSHYWTEYRSAAPGTIHRRRVQALMIAFHIVYLGSVDYLAKFGIQVYPLGYVPIAVFLVLVARAIHRYHLVGISPAFAVKDIIGAMGNALLVVDVAGVVRIVNRVACELFGIPEPQFVGSPMAKLDHGLASLASPETASRGLMRETEFTLTNGTGSGRNLSATASVMRDPSGRPLATVWIISDMTQRKRAEERLRKAHEQLKRSHDALQAAQLQLLQAAKLESVGRLAAGVAHEVRNPLAIILLSAEYLSKHLTDRSEQTRMALQDVHRAVRRADTVIRGLLNFASAQAIALRAESLNGIIEQSLLLVKHEVEKARVRVVKQLDPALPPCRLDRQKIEQVFVNLFINAVHAMPEGGTLTVRTLNRRLTEVGPRTGMRMTDQFKIGEAVVEAQVEDTGPGVPPEHLPKVFDPFFTTKPAGQGTGLGLAVSRSIVELHGGEIRLANLASGGVGASVLFKAEGLEEHHEN